MNGGNLTPITNYSGCKVFTATKAKDRDFLGDAMTDWLKRNPNLEIIETVALQSSDNAFHCLSMVVFYRQAGIAAGTKAA